MQLNEIDGKKMLHVDVRDHPVVISGFAWFDSDQEFCRLPVSELPKMSEKVRRTAWNSSGGMARFRSDSGTIAIKVQLAAAVSMAHMARSGSCGLDLYHGQKNQKQFTGVKLPLPQDRSAYEKILVEGWDREMRDWTLDFPLYNGIKQVVVGLDPDAKIEPPTPFTVAKPILFYGSSITQGCAASRPGNAYIHIIARRLDANLVNLGFSGAAKGEPEMAGVIASVDMSVFVMDYDYNAPSAEHLAQTHEPFFQIVREAQPDLPIVIVSSPSLDADPARWGQRREVVRRTYENAVQQGDTKVWFVDGQTLYGTTDRDACTTDLCHPNDLGFMRMADAIGPVVNKALEAGNR
tara:strand:- start:408 stop:1457 length:1050 start_codon:yes stop_codon:yes gene_type:complete